MQSKNGDADSEGPGGEDSLDRLDPHYRDENSPSLEGSEDSGSEDDDADGAHQGRKRRKVSKSASSAYWQIRVKSKEAHNAAQDFAFSCKIIRRKMDIGRGRNRAQDETRWQFLGRHPARPSAPF
ncbi:hypothetical protein CDV36_016557 [Fusarium kuroshium]|uniref:Uncharacterized protein n=1 Tax=Fusarium kuroshium TaxID=2010991 RepID=A0A3M2QLA7_9HYPO|nr:hypothetical protein CDV36_016557 [Fusarium kuroshium]